MSEHVVVRMGELHAAHNPCVLQTSGIGSCIAVALYDPVAKVGGLAHAMLPRQPEAGAPSQQRYVPVAVPVLVAEMIKLGAVTERMIAKLVGGAHMFSLYGDANKGIGAENIAAAREALQQQGIPVAGEEVGGSVGRTLTFDLVTGICSVETKM